MRGRVHGEVEVLDLGVGVGGAPGGHGFGGQLARGGAGGEDAGIDVEQLHVSQSLSVQGVGAEKWPALGEFYF
ncbi:hypothetical protein D9M69_602880 [compost metagenome]